ncbi:MAG TPA: beta-ketoacyl synthase N-terminal-like domain-containing protein [Polyangiaceae bacterium]
MRESIEDEAEGYQIAVVGMAGRFPGAKNLREFWANVRDGVESVHFFSEQELLDNGEDPRRLSDPNYVRAWPVLEDFDHFDARFFGISPRDAAVMDPQHRLFLEITWEALENAGYAPNAAPGQVGVFAACGMNHYMMYHLVTNREVMETVGEWLVRHTGNDMNFLATRVSYQLDLKGPSLNVQTACSSSLVTVHLACQSLLNGECDMALAGGSTLSLPQDRGYLFKEGEILSPDGHCRPFDAGSHGTLFGSGTGCVVLKRLADAEAQGDQILAVIRGSAINNDGSQKVGYLAPSVSGQSSAIAEALAVSGVPPATIGYVEAHGTGTAVGDPIEVRALTEAFRAGTTDRSYCGLGSLKANIGHLGEAAGIAAFIKTVLALRAGTLPPSINYTQPNPEIDFPGSPFFVNTRLREWPALGAPRRAGVTALGAGGTNAHVVLEEAPARATLPGVAGPKLFVLSARSETALDRAVQQLAGHLDQELGLDASDVAFTLQQGRTHFDFRKSVVAESLTSLRAALLSGDPQRLHTGVAPRRAPGVAFLFPGGGAQYPGMGAGLYELGEPFAAYRRAIDECISALEPLSRDQVRRLLMDRDADGAELERPGLALPALFATEYATAKLLMSLGVEPSDFIGHSMGEYVAACLCGVFTPAEGMGLVTRRGKLFESLPEGGMLSVALSEADLAGRLPPELSIAAVNAPQLCVVSGPAAAIEGFAEKLDADEIDWQRIHIAVAAHSAMLEPILADFANYCRGIRFKPPHRPWISNRTGQPVLEADAIDPDYWVRHLRSTVRFADGMKTLLDRGSVLVEIGPGRTLTSLARQQSPAAVAVTTLRHPRESVSDEAYLLDALGRLWVAGLSPSFERLCDSTARRVALPTYPFERARYFIPARSPVEPEQNPLAFQPRKLPDLRDWFETMVWKEAPAPVAQATLEPCLIFADKFGLAARLRAKIPGSILVRHGERFMKHSAHEYSIHFAHQSDYQTLFEHLSLAGRMPGRLVHLAAVTAPQSVVRGLWGANSVSYQDAEALYFKSLLFIAQTLAGLELAANLDVVTSNLHAIGLEPRANPEKALVLGPVRVIPREIPEVETRNIDLQMKSAKARELERLAAELAEELPNTGPRVVALRGGLRFVQTLEPLPLEPSSTLPAKLREGGVYLITGGLGDIGQCVAHYLARSFRAKLVLLGRTQLPERSQYDEWVAEHGSGDPISAKIAAVRAIEAAGGEVLTPTADASDVNAMQGVRELILKRFGRLHGIIHSAGTLDDALISLKTEESASRVLQSKVKSLLVLDQVFGQDQLELMLLFSSVSSLLGLEGQIDYTAANAVLDAYACARRQRGCLTQSISWNAWKDLGMAVATVEAARPAGRAERGRLGPHPCLERLVLSEPDEALFATTLTRVRHWLLGEHVVRDGDAVIPGTGYLEIARAAASHVLGVKRLELSDVAFMEPFVVPPGQAKDLAVRVQRTGPDGVEILFFAEDMVEPLAIASARVLGAPDPAAMSLSSVAERVGVRTVEVHGQLNQPFMDFGARWANIERIHFGSDEALIHLSLPESFRSDLTSYELHPALMDMATGAAQALVPGIDLTRDFLVPLGYRRVRVYDRLGTELISHVKLRGNATSQTVGFDVRIVDRKGRVLVDIEGFTMKRVNSAEFGRATASAAPSLSAPPSMRINPTSQLAQVIEHGITKDEGVEALVRLITSGRSGHFFASSLGVKDWLAFVDASSPGAQEPPRALDGADEPAQERQLRNSYVEPRNELEATLCQLYQELLGVQRVGAHDDFFELGGQSLMAVRLFNKIRKRYQVDLPLSTLFEAPTPAQCAQVVASELGIDLTKTVVPEAQAVPSVEEVVAGAETEPVAEVEASPHPSSIPVPPDPNRKGTRWRSLVVMQPQGVLPPFFCVAGMGGTLNNLRKLAMLAGDARPFIGLQPPGADGNSQMLFKVEELAEHYIQEVRSIRPHGPYLLGGYSGGGVVAFEMARRLTAAGESVSFLGFIDTFSPNPPKRSAWGRAKIHARRTIEQGPRYLASTLQRRFEYRAPTRKLKRKLQSLFPENYRYENLAASWLVAESQYQPGVWDGSATLFRAREETALSLWTAVEVDEQHGWGRFVKGGVDVQICPGNHATMCLEPFVRVLASKLREAIDAKSPVTAERPTARRVSGDGADSAPGHAPALVPDQL